VRSRRAGLHNSARSPATSTQSGGLGRRRRGSAGCRTWPFAHNTRETGAERASFCSCLRAATHRGQGPGSEPGRQPPQAGRSGLQHSRVTHGRVSEESGKT
jgi:hypothetical protein